jgi:DNA-binding transcriptional ArsR family regulator
MGTVADSPPWYQRFAAAETGAESELYRALADERRRAVLTTLCRRDAPVSESRLAHLVTAREATDSPNAAATADRDRVETSLHHVHLPHLEAAGLVERSDDEGVDCTRHPFWTDADVRALLTRDDVAPDATTATFDLLADDRRRAILTLLRSRHDLTADKIAEELAGTPLSGQELPNLTAELAHRHLSKLADDDVVEVDSARSRVRYTGNAVLEAWFGDVRSRREA